MSSLSKALDDALLLALVLRWAVQSGGWLVRSRSDANVGSNSLSAKPVDSLMTSLDRLADDWKTSLEIGAVAAVEGNGAISA